MGTGMGMGMGKLVISALGNGEIVRVQIQPCHGEPEVREREHETGPQMYV